MDRERLTRQYVALLSESCTRRESGESKESLLEKLVYFGLSRKEALKRIPVVGALSKKVYRKVVLKLLK